MKKSVVIVLLLGCMARADAQAPWAVQIDREYARLEAMYYYLHQHPELSFKEKETSRYMADELRRLGFEVTEQVGGYGVVGVLRNGTGPTLLIRTDLDALPVTEETGKAYASKVTTVDDQGRTVGVMHACGHDVHMTVWAGTAQLLMDLRKQWKGTLVMIGQPAEERGGGAKAMLADGLYEKFPKPDFALALHTNALLPAGTVGVCSGYAMANVDMVDITVYGEGGHGAYPHTTRDPVVLASELVLAMQTLVSREKSPLEPAVLTVGSIHGGSKGNIIPNEVRLELTLRSYTDEVRNDLIAGIRRIAQGLAIAAGLPEDKYPVVTVRDEYVPSLYNDPALTDRLTGVYRQVLGSGQVRTVSPVMGGEDFSRYGKTDPAVPVHLVWLGVVAPDRAAAAERGELSLPSLHSSQFAPVIDPAIKTGIIALTAAALDLLQK
ncbi:MAG: amidohydrolase [Bacteroidia bacterium]|nr:amidohydrolase [Bacteroidia bacterium]